MISAVGAWLLTTFTSLPWLSRALLVVWSLTMISVPILQWIWGPTGRHYGIIAGVLLQAATVISNSQYETEG